MVCVHDLCARVQNGFISRLAKIAIPETSLNLSVARVLFQQGFIYSVTRGTHMGPDEIYTPTTNLNIAERRLWLSLKYYQDKPVLNRMQCISKPSRKIKITPSQAQTLVSGYASGLVKGLTPGEVVIINTPKGVMDLNQAVKEDVGGMLLARVS
ncbi:hypothetical protein BB560_002142 [Smittium megazygosporum]|uniref:30S ribosomal protein S8 n=1 Tax=Smittium megazygosporum TaxID=133381 RepID=A0A2T9ZFM8_9FUNG|nr:hypothetical protein BB560_002142 [Smittium megazygosporum]